MMARSTADDSFVRRQFGSTSKMIFGPNAFAMRVKGVKKRIARFQVLFYLRRFLIPPPLANRAPFLCGAETQ